MFTEKFLIITKIKHKKCKWMTYALLKSINSKNNYTKSGLKQM